MGWKRWRTHLGAVAIALSLGGILVATILSPSFAWTGNALSDLGVAWSAAGTSATALAFNGGLIAGGAVGLAFTRALAATARTRAERIVVALFGLTVVLMGLVGVFPRGSSLHLPVAVGFYVLVSLTLWADGLARFAGAVPGRWLPGLTFGTVNLLAWVAWAATGSILRGGVAVPETVGALALAGWVAIASVRPV